MCKHWLSNGFCHRGSACTFAHSFQELRVAPSLVGTRLCFQFASKGQCNKGQACTFAHGQQELRSMPREAESPVQSAMESMDTKVAPALSKMQLLQRNMNQLAALHMQLSLLRPPPGLTPLMPPGSWSIDSMDNGAASSTSFPSTPRNGPASEQGEMFRL
eukprot:Skav224465  [mRNA]  locus=scaffold1302:419819:420298:- [translate_table: standard]